ncbi:MAG: hypothetical protein JWO08_4274 [Verrucomicrobiaceae bacterium]|nr:hypothetical protein [Verrucomicrobiaceae bacterium]
MTLFLCIGFAVVVSTFILWRTQHWSGGGRTALIIAGYYAAGVAGYAIDRLFGPAAPGRVDAYYLRLCDSALLSVVVLSAIQEAVVGILFDLYSKWRGGIPIEKRKTKVSEPEIGSGQ